MRTSLKKLSKFIGGRFFRNLLFWAFLLLLTISGRNISLDKNAGWYYMFLAATTLQMLILTYTNNLVLVPRLLVKRKIILYVLAVLALTTIISISYTLTIKLALSHFPVLKVQQIASIHVPVSTTWSIEVIMQEVFEGYFFGFLLWILIFTMAWYMTDYARQARIAEEARKKQMEAELSFLRNQMNPHFLFNTLNNIYGLTLKKSDKAPLAVMELSQIMRYILYESDMQLTTFEKEKEIMEAYINLELLRLNNDNDVHITILSDDSCLIPPLLWLPVLENVFKHGTRFITDKHYIEYRFIIAAKKLMIYSKNTYKTVLKKTDDNETGGIGLSNLRKRLTMLYPGKHQIHAYEENDYFITEVNILLA